MRKIIITAVLLLFFLQLFFRIYQYRGEYASRFDAAYWRQRYLQSQWVVSNSKNPIGDDGLYAYAGWEYINGLDPTKLNAEAPPIGKYLIGLSIVMFHNQNIFALLSGLFVLASYYFLNIALFRDRLIAFLPVVFFSFEPLFFTQLRAPFLDLLYVGFFLLCLAFFLRKQYLPFSIFLGFMAGTKNSVSTFLLVIMTTTLYLFLGKQFGELRRYLFSLPLAIIVLLFSYARFFMNGHTIIDFLKVQKYIFNFYAVGVKGTIIAPWQILLTGHWPTWFGGVQMVGEWHVGWAVLLVLIILYWVMMMAKYFPHGLHKTFLPERSRRLKTLPPFDSLRSLREKYVISPSSFFKSSVDQCIKEQQALDLLAIWLFVYLTFLSFIPMFPRYLLLALPFLYNVAMWAVIKGIKSTKSIKG